jgi:hypothetical protein
MNPKRKTLQRLVGGIAACVSTSVFAVSEIAVYHSPD